MRVEENKSLKNHNTFGIACNARYFVSIETIDELKQALSEKPSKELFILGGGSNMLLTGDLDAYVLHINLKGIEILKETETEVLVKAMAGENWHEFVQYCIANDFGGLENLSLIPGNVGTAFAVVPGDRAPSARVSQPRRPNATTEIHLHFARGDRRRRGAFRNGDRRRSRPDTDRGRRSSESAPAGDGDRDRPRLRRPRRPCGAVGGFGDHQGRPGSVGAPPRDAPRSVPRFLALRTGVAVGRALGPALGRFRFLHFG